jgi:hypothetical protein
MACTIVLGGFALATITEAIGVFLLDREAQNLAEKTLTTYRKRLTKFMDWCEDRSITTVGDLTLTNVRLYQVHLVKTMADVSAKNHMVDVKTFLKFCVAQQIISESPAAKLKLPRVVERLPKVLAPNQVGLLSSAVSTPETLTLPQEQSRFWQASQDVTGAATSAQRRRQHYGPTFMPRTSNGAPCGDRSGATDG